VSAPPAAAVRLDRVGFSYGAAPLAFDADFPAGAVTAVMGASGSGKTTLLHLVAGFETPARGRILVGGSDVTALPPERRPVSMVFQENNLFAHLAAEANVALGMKPSLRLTPPERERVAAALGRVGLGGKGERLPRELSGGERSRVALARVLVRERPVLLLDEPFAALGPGLRRDMAELVRALAREKSMTVLFVTHQPDDAQLIADRVVFLADGTVAAQGQAAGFFGGGGPPAFRSYIGEAVRRGG
jgi:thiamine transport system ATP-binding protein